MTPAPTHRVSARLSAIAPSATLAVDAKAKALKAAGRPVIGFGAGEPPGHPQGSSGDVARHCTPAGPGVAHPTACGYRKCLLVWQTRAPLKGSGAIGSAPVSKTGGCGFESRLPC